MAIVASVREKLSRAQRLKRHMSALVRYHSPYRVYNLLLLESERLTKKVIVKGKPYILIIDPLNTCQLKCPFCPTGLNELPLPKGKMRLDQFQAFIDDIAPHTIKMSLYNWGEPFLHREILDMISHAHKRRISTAISSNLNALPPGGGEAVVRSGLDDLVVSCDGLTQETYVQYRKGGKLADVVANLKDITDAKKRLRSKTPHIEFQFLVFRHNEHEVGQVEQFAKDLGADEVRLLAPYINLESKDLHPSTLPEFVKAIYKDESVEQADTNMFVRNPPQEAAIAKNPPPLSCFWPWRSLAVNWNGEIDPCCFPNYLDSFGCVFEEPLAKIWNGPAYLAARRWIKGETLQEEDPLNIVCRGCPGYH